MRSNFFPICSRGFFPNRSYCSVKRWKKINEIGVNFFSQGASIVLSSLLLVLCLYFSFSDKKKLVAQEDIAKKLTTSQPRKRRKKFSNEKEDEELLQRRECTDAVSVHFELILVPPFGTSDNVPVVHGLDNKRCKFYLFGTRIV